ncbi:MAG: hypothetical protein J6J86_04525 [Lachnospiraceae bacterium]|nr:hypothetical protein [Lachnospiraceae bacterium]MBP3543470.1 hypothetical protein [Lachnospiraceae bacterium]
MGYWEGIGPEDGKIVDDEAAFRYALERCTKGTEAGQIRRYDHLCDKEREEIEDGEPLRD